MSTISEKLEDLHSEMDNHELVEDSERVDDVVETVEGIDEVHITVVYENLEEVESEVNDFDWELVVLYREDLNMDKMKVEDDDEYKLVVGYAGRM